jgi:hypothetical protein
VACQEKSGDIRLQFSLVIPLLVLSESLLAKQQFTFLERQGKLLLYRPVFAKKLYL